MINQILTTLNAPLKVNFLYDAKGNPVQINTLSGLPLGTDTNASDGQLGLKVIIIADNSANSTTDQVTPTFHSMGASASYSIPIGAKGWTVVFLTGTGTIGGQAVSAGFADSDSGTLAAAIALTTGATSSAYVRYNS